MIAKAVGRRSSNTKVPNTNLDGGKLLINCYINIKFELEL